MQGALKMLEFEEEIKQRLVAAAVNQQLKTASNEFMRASISSKYSYNFKWMGRPIIQYPQDIMAMQEIIWKTRPDVIIETGIAHGGSLILSASMLAMLDYCDAVQNGNVLDTSKSNRKVIGVDVDIRSHNREAIEQHQMQHLITMIEGSSTDVEVVEKVKCEVGTGKKVLVSLDSNHTHEHVLAELNAYAPIVSNGSYCVVFDTVIENLPVDAFRDRPWGIGDNPMTAVGAWLEKNSNFVIDEGIDNQLLISVAPRGFLKKLHD